MFEEFSQKCYSIDTYPIQSDLDELFQWSQTFFNDSKFAHMHFWSEQPTEAVTYYINGKIISSVNRTEDLGIFIIIQFIIS